MNLKFTFLSATLLLTSSLASFADEPKEKRPASPEFERLKSLVGTWQGKADFGQGPVDFVKEVRLIAAGTVIEERDFPGTPNEMVTMFYDNKDGKLALTHYCVLGNRPAMALKSSDQNSLTFDLDSCCGIDAKESHMHALTLRFDDADTVTTSCTAIIDGKTAPDHQITLKRVKTVAQK